MSVRGLQERAARALPASQVEHVGGWWLRHAPGSAWWVGTVLPHGAIRPDELVPRVVAAEQFYAAHGAPARFQISPSACPEELDAVLAERGYHRRSAVSLQVAPTEAVRQPSSRVRLDERPTPAWFAVHGDAGDSDMMGRVAQPSVFAATMIGKEVVAVGRAVADTGWAGVFGMATLPQARGSGAGRAVLAALADWAGEHGADRMYLQVECANIAALRLYERTGFNELCIYHYRTATRGPAADPRSAPRTG